MTPWRIIPALIIVLVLQAPAWASTLYVQSREAPLLSEPSFGAEQITTLNQGDELTLLESQGSWRQVEFGDHTGWVSRLVVSDTPALGRVGVITGDEEQMEGSVRRRTSAVVTAGAARGLTPEDRARASEAGLSNYSALYDMENIVIDEEEVMSFHREVQP
ncbi:SH3 domain-containing protein [Desulfurispira natronophila]|uniref:SH3b domain-containing protein n=1 Tax=Desulfurispira natronophila TaxID=682562 RepID=A0A7W7Y354_9BACT|nr:SH3 domain-containing protein [Desulfurispira natronophila]MBB5020937.1 hypothetical protein [Desulfurispira natronophila]